jgi:hypothetical protein
MESPLDSAFAERPVAALRVHVLSTPSGFAWKGLRPSHTARIGFGEHQQRFT